MASRAWALYNTCLHKRPLATKMAMSAVVLGTADLGAQLLQHRQQPHHHTDATTCHRKPFSLDVTRQQAVFVLALGFQGPFGHWWYPFLERSVRARLPAHLVLPGKVLGEQLVNAFSSNVIYFSFIPWFEGRPLGEIARKLRMDLGPTYLIDCCFWPIAGALYFRYVPVQHHLLACNCVLLVWTLFMSYVCHDDKLLRVFDAYNVCLTDDDRRILRERHALSPTPPPVAPPAVPIQACSRSP